MRVERLRGLQAPGAWFWLALAVGAALRVYLIGWTEGTFDVAIKHHHGNQILKLGLVGWYQALEIANHPPLMGRFFAALTALSEATGIPFRILMRAPFSLLDLGTACLLWRLMIGSPWRWVLIVACWLHPLSILFSSYHGNTDSAVAFFALLATLLVSRSRPALAGVALGVGLWVKLPVLVAAPVLLAAVPDWSGRGRFVASAAGVAVVGYLPVLFQEPVLLLTRILGYEGTRVEMPSGVVVWGIMNAIGLKGSALADALAAANTWVCWLPILLYAWLRRGAFGPRELAISVAGAYLILYGFTSHWAWQYLAWSIPFWLCLGWRFAAATVIILGGYVYGAYALMTGSALLQGRWDFVSHAAWPPLLDLLRDASVVLCFGAAVILIGQALLRETRWRRATSEDQE